MPDSANPFSGNVPRQMTKGELIRALRLDIAAEHEAIHMYTAQAEASDDPLARAASKSTRYWMKKTADRILSAFIPPPPVRCSRALQLAFAPRARFSSSRSCQGPTEPGPWSGTFGP